MPRPTHHFHFPAGLRRMLLASLVLVPCTALAAPPDDTDFLFRLGMLEGHLMIGHDLIKAGQNGLALPHFGHPVRELYDDIEGYIAAKRIPPFDAQLIKLEAAVAGAPQSPQTETLYQAAIKTLHDARNVAPASIRDSVPSMIKICSDTIDAAAGEYGESLNRGKIDAIVEYHDSRGYISYVAQAAADLSASHPDPASQSMLSRFKTVLAKAQWIVDPLLPAATPRASVGQYRTVAAEAAGVATSER